MKLDESALIKIDQSITDLNTRKSTLSTQKKRLELELSTLNNRVRASDRLPKDEYAAICRKQRECKDKIFSIDDQITQINNEISKKHNLGQEVRVEIKKNKSEEIKTRLVKLRDDYLQFSSDATRVSSMRVMASQVAEQIEAIIKTL